MKEVIKKLLEKNAETRLQNALKLRTMSYFRDFDWDSMRTRQMKTPIEVKDIKAEEKEEL